MDGIVQDGYFTHIWCLSWGGWNIYIVSKKWLDISIPKRKEIWWLFEAIEEERLWRMFHSACGWRGKRQMTDGCSSAVIPTDWKSALHWKEQGKSVCPRKEFLNWAVEKHFARVSSRGVTFVFENLSIFYLYLRETGSAVTY